MRKSRAAFSLMLAEFPGNGTSDACTNRYIKKLLWKSWRHDKRINRVRFFDESSTPIDMLRNQAIAECQKHSIDYCLMVDSDMSPDCEPDGKPFWETSWDFMYNRRVKEMAYRKGLYAIMDEKTSPDYKGQVEAAEAAIFKSYPPATIGAPYCGPPPMENVYVFKWTDFESNTPNTNYRLEQYERDQVIPYTGIWEVAGLPTGLILYDVRLFNTLPQPWFAYEFTDTPRNTNKGSTEDVFQSRNASMLGFPQYCNWDAWAGHNKKKIVGKPQPIRISKVPAAMADALRKGVTEDHKVVMIKRGDDLRDDHPKVIEKPATKDEPKKIRLS